MDADTYRLAMLASERMDAEEALIERSEAALGASGAERATGVWTDDEIDRYLDEEEELAAEAEVDLLADEAIEAAINRLCDCGCAHPGPCRGDACGCMLIGCERCSDR